MNVSPDNLMRAFARGERELAVPACISVRRAGESASLQALAVLRLLPRKRLVLRAELGGRTVAIKWFAADAGGRRHLQRERAGFAAVQAAKLHAPEILDELRTPDGAYVGLVYTWVDAAPELARLWPAFSDLEKRLWLGELLGAMARLHHAGGCQTDIHLGNFLLRDKTLWLLDLGSIRAQSTVLDLRASLTNIAALAAQLAPAERYMVDELLVDYLQQRGWSNTGAARRIYGAALARQWRVRYRDYLQKARRDCSLTMFARDFSRVCAARRSQWGAGLEHFCTDPEAMLAGAQVQVLKAGNTATVVRTVIDAATVVIKRYNIKSWRHALSRCWRPTRAAHSWQFAHLLEIAGIRSPQPLALVERRWGWLRGRAYFVCAAVSGENLLALGERGVLTPAVLESLRQLLLGLRRERISHGDFKATNFLVSGDAVTLIDLDAMRRHRTQAGFERAFRRDLARLQRNWPEGSAARRQIDELVTEVGRRS